MSKENLKKSKFSFKILLVIILLVVLITLIPIGFALFSHKKDDKVLANLKEIEVVLVEDWPEFGGEYENDNHEIEVYNQYGISKKTKIIHGHSIKEMDAYVRVRLIPIIEYYDTTTSEWITAPVSQDKFIVTVTGDKWIKSGDYWYYKEILPGFEDTDVMNIAWQVTDIPTEIAKYTMRTNVRVILEYAQTTNEMWKDLFQIDSLPTGVEQVQE